MAFVPCAIHGQMFKGGASTFFPALVNGSESHRKRVQTCPNCAAVLLERAQQNLQKVSEGDTFFEWSQPVDCANCHKTIGKERWAFYVSAYPRGLSESQWYGLVHPECVSAVAEDWNIT
jgi:hypothetical protein